ncbi:MAG TPA: hypothetical protein DCY26_02065, partial [Hyphomonas sp.]|nr:hypothetical protein [Hyphomonas sp.]
MQNITTFLRRTHNLLALIVGAQVLIWVASGFFFALRPIEEVRGEHLRTLPQETLPEAEMAAPETILAAAGEPVKTLRLKNWLGAPVWEAETASGKRLYDGVTGARLDPVTEESARKVAEDRWVGDGELVALSLIEAAPSEAGRGAGRPMWRAEFEGRDNASLWIDPQDGELVAVRTDWWRTFDLFWGLHIMDWTNRETISSWWMKLFAFGSLVLSLAGIW